MKLLSFLVFFIPAAAVTLLQVRKLANKGEVKAARLYFVLMSLAVVMFGLAVFNHKLIGNPLSILIPFEYIGKYFLE